MIERAQDALGRRARWKCMIQHGGAVEQHERGREAYILDRVQRVAKRGVEDPAFSVIDRQEQRFVLPAAT